MNKRKTYKIKIGYRVFKLRFVKRVDAQDSQGECDYIKGLIRIKSSLSGEELYNTIMHEINHAILYDRGLNLSDKTDERIVLAFTNGYHDFFQSNIDFHESLVDLIVG